MSEFLLRYFAHLISVDIPLLQIQTNCTNDTLHTGLPHRINMHYFYF